MLFINAADINNILNIVLIVLFAGAIVGLVFAIIRGIVRGFWKSTFYLAWYTTLILLAVFTLTPLIEAIGATDLTEYGFYLNMTVGEETYSLAVTTIKETLHGGIAMAMTLNGLEGSAAMISERAWVLSTAILKYAVFLVDIILILILGTFFGWLLWICIFKHIVPKVVRKRVKLRVISALEESVMFVVLTGLFLSPFTSLVNIANQSWQKSQHDTDNETIQMVDTFMNTYNDSLFAKTFFNWTVDESGLTLDAKLINEVTKSTAEDVSVSVLETVSGLGEVGAVVAGALVGNPSEGESPLNIGYLLSEESLTQIFSSINKSQIISYALPLAITLALNVEQVKQVVDPKIVNLSDIDWLTQLQNLETVVMDVLNSGIVDDFINPDKTPVEGGSEQSNDIKAMMDKVLSDKAYPYVTRIFNSIDENDLLSRVVPSLMWYLTEQNPEMGDMMPKTWEEMNLLTWGNELNIVYDNLFRLNKQAPELVDNLLTMTGGQPAPDNNPTGPVETIKKNAGEPLPEENPEPETPQEPTPGENQTADILNLVIDNMDAFAGALIGEFDENGNLKNIDKYGRSIVYDKNGKKIPGRHYTLMDSTLFSYVFPNLLNTLTSSMTQGENPFVKPETLQKAFDKLASGVALKNYKQELGALFTAFKGVVSNDTLKNMILDPNSAGASMDTFTDEKFVNSMVNILPAFKASQIFKIAIEPMMIEQITSQKEMLDQIGLKAESITSHLDEKRDEYAENEDGYYDYFFDELAFLLRQMPNMLEISTMMSEAGGDSNALFDKLYSNVDKLAGLLDAVYESDILNPSNKRSGIVGNNFFDILTHLFGGDTPLIKGLSLNFKQLQDDGVILQDARYLNANGSKIHKWTNTKTQDGKFLTDAYGHPIFDGETGYIANVLVSLGHKAEQAYNPSGSQIIYDKGATLVSVLTSEIDVTQIIGRLDADFKISKVFASVDDSTLFSSMFGPFLDSTLAGTGFIDESTTSFKNIKDWTAEGVNFAAICNSIDQAGVDLTNLDLQKIDNIPALNIMLHSLADSQLFESRSGNDYLYSFNTFLYDKLKSLLVTPESDMLADPYTKQADTKTTYTKSMKYFDLDPDKPDSLTSTIDSPSKKSASWVNEDWMNQFKQFDDNTADLEELLKNPENEEFFYSADNISSVCNVLRRLLETKKHAEDAYAHDNDPNKPAFDSSNVSQLMSSGYADINDLENLLQGIYACKPAKMILYNAIASLGDIKITDDLTLAGINAEFFIYENEAGTPGAEIPNIEQVQKQEISNFITIYTKLNDITKNQDLSAGNFDKLLADKTNIVVLNEILQMMNESYCLHRAGKAIAHKDFDLTDNGGIDQTTYVNKTVFQSLVETFTLSPMILTMLYQADSDKDKAYFDIYKGEADKIEPGHVYSDPMSQADIDLLAQAKADYLLEKVFPVIGKNEDKTYDYQLKEVSKIVEIASSLLGGYKNVHDIMTVKSSDGKTLTSHLYDVVDGVKIPHTKTVEEELVKNYSYPGLPDSSGKPTMDFTQMDYRKITGQNIKGIINTINDSDLLFDLAPNALHEVFSNIGNKGNSSENDVFALALQKADPYYLYEFGEVVLKKTNELEKYDTRFFRPEDKSRLDENELDNIANMIDEYVKTLDADGNGGNIFAGGIKVEMVDLAETLLDTLSSSYIFHKGVLIDQTKNPINARTKASSFEELFGQFYIMTGITNILPIDHNIDGSISEYGETQLMNRIFSKTRDDTLKTEGKNSWGKEIDTMCALAKKVITFGLDNLEGFAVDMNNPLFAPDNVAELLVFFNNVDTCDGALSKIMDETFNSVGLKELTKYNFSEDAGTFKYALKTDLAQDEWGGEVLASAESEIGYKGVYKKGEEIYNVHELLNAFSIKEPDLNGQLVHKSYVTISGSADANPMKFISEQKLTTNLLSYLHSSTMFTNVVDDIYVSDAKKTSATAESLFFYNTMEKAQLTQFITGNGIGKLNTINWIMSGYEAKNNKPLYKPASEAIALDTLIHLTDSFIGGDFQFENLSTSRLTIKAIIGSLTREVTFNDGVPTITDTVHDRSYLCSEIISSILDKFMNEIVTNDLVPLGFTDEYRLQFNAAGNIYSDIDENSYDLLNIVEANAVDAILNVYEQNLVKDSANQIDAAATGEKLVNYFMQPDGMDWSQFMYPGSKRNSYIASVVYAGKINPFISQHIGGIDDSLTTVLTTLDDNIKLAEGKQADLKAGLDAAFASLQALKEQYNAAPDYAKPALEEKLSQAQTKYDELETAYNETYKPETGLLAQSKELRKTVNGIKTDLGGIKMGVTDLFMNKTTGETAKTFVSYGESIVSLLQRYNDIKTQLENAGIVL